MLQHFFRVVVPRIADRIGSMRKTAQPQPETNADSAENADEEELKPRRLSGIEIPITSKLPIKI